MNIIENMPNGEYHAHPAIGSTSLKILATQTPAHYQWSRTHSDHKPQYDFGSAAHAWILEGDESQIVVVDAQNWMTKAAKDLRKKAHEEGRYPVLIREWNDIMQMRQNVLNHPMARLMVADDTTQIESSIFWEEDGMPLKCRPDAYNRHGIWDLKTAVSADPGKFSRAAVDYGYHQSAAHYQDGVKAVHGRAERFRFVVIEKAAPFLVNVIELDTPSESLGSEMNTEAKAIWRECTRRDEWPGYEGQTIVSVPQYAFNDFEEMEV